MIDIYLACPYTYRAPEWMPKFLEIIVGRYVRYKRFKLVTYYSGVLMKMGFVVFSPISHSHVVALKCVMPTTWDFWEKQDLRFLDNCKILVVLTLSGWRYSTGVIDEMKHTLKNKKDIIFWDGKEDIKNILINKLKK